MRIIQKYCPINLCILQIQLVYLYQELSPDLRFNKTLYIYIYIRVVFCRCWRYFFVPCCKSRVQEIIWSWVIFQSTLFLHLCNISGPNNPDKRQSSKYSLYHEASSPKTSFTPLVSNCAYARHPSCSATGFPLPTGGADPFTEGTLHIRCLRWLQPWVPRKRSDSLLCTG